MNQQVIKKGKAIAVTGIHAIDAILSQSPHFALRLWTDGRENTRLRALCALATRNAISIETVRTAKLDVHAFSHQGVLLWCNQPRIHSLQWLGEHAENFRLLLALDQVTDAHNFGACLRTAEAAGVDAVLFSERNSSAVNAGMSKAASGALFRIPLVRTHLPLALAKMRSAGFTAVALSEHSEQSMYCCQWNNRVVVVAGSEQRGISARTLAHCYQVCIPCKGENASLNVSVAVAVALFEIRRQQN